MSDETADPRKDAGYDTPRSTAGAGDDGLLFSSLFLLALVAIPLMILSLVFPGQVDERARLTEIHSLPADAHAIVDRGHGWVEFTLTTGGEDHRYLRGWHSRGEVLTEIRPAK